MCGGDRLSCPRSPGAVAVSRGISVFSCETIVRGFLGNFYKGHSMDKKSKVSCLVHQEISKALIAGSLYIAAAQQQHSSSGTTASVLQALVFTPAVTVYVWSWCTTDDRTTGNIFTPNATIKQTSFIGPHTGYREHVAASNSSYQVHITGTHVFPFFDLRHPPDIKASTHRRGALYINILSTKKHLSIKKDAGVVVVIVCRRWRPTSTTAVQNTDPPHPLP